jgi:hypothetical protein
MVVHEEEVPMGYPEHIRRVRGHLAEAARESVSYYPYLADLFRQWRRYLLEEPFKAVPPYDAILDYVDALVALDKAGTASQRVHIFKTLDDDNSPEIPAELHPPGADFRPTNSS